MRRIKKLTNKQLGRTNPVIEREELRLYLGGTGPYNDQDTINYQTALILSPDSMIQNLIRGLRQNSPTLDLQNITNCSNCGIDKRNIAVSVGSQTIHVTVQGYVYQNWSVIPTTPNGTGQSDPVAGKETYEWRSGTGTYGLGGIMIAVSYGDRDVFENILNAY